MKTLSGLALAVLAGVLLFTGCQVIDSENPVVTIVFPADGSNVPRASMTVKARAIDNNGVTKVEFYVDDVLKSTVNAGVADTFSYVWDASGLVAGSSHDLNVKAFDAAGNFGEDEATVTVGSGGGSGPTHHSGEIESDTWYAVGNPHIIDNDVKLAENATLVIKPGCIVQFSSGTELYCGYVKPGAIIAEGTPDSLIYFTSGVTPPAPGDWQDIGLYDKAMSTTSFRYCVVEYAGSSNNSGAFQIDYDNAKIRDTRIRQCKYYGIVCQSEAAFSQFTNNRIDSCGSYPIHIRANHVSTMGAGNRFVGNAPNAIAVRGGPVEQSGTWLNYGVPYVCEGDINVSDATGTPTLTIAPGTTIKMNSSTEFYCGYVEAGGIVAVGTPDSMITFTSNVNPPSPGDWTGVVCYQHTTSNTDFRYCKIAYGGDGNGANLRIDGTSLKVRNCRIESSENYGVKCEASASFDQFTDNTVTGCASYSIFIHPDYVSTIGAGNTLTGNTVDGIGVYGGQVHTTGTWLNHGVPYWILGDVGIGYNATSPVITIAAGNTLKLASGIEFYVGYAQPGGLICDGTGGQITFTSSVNPPSAGDWVALEFYDNTTSQSMLKNCRVEYAGSSQGNIFIRSCAPDIQGCTIANSENWGIYLEGSPTPDPAQLRANNTFVNCASGDVGP